MGGVRAGLGFCNDVGVCIRLDDGAPRLVARRALSLVDRADRHVYHRAAEAGDLTAAKAVIAQGEAAAAERARREVGALIAEAAALGAPPTAAGMTIGSGHLEPTLDRLLASHIQLHMAEGVLYREAVAQAVEHHGLAVVRIHEKAAVAEACGKIGLTPAEVEPHLAAKTLGAATPWRRAEKLATAAAWAALAG